MNKTSGQTLQNSKSLILWDGGSIDYHTTLSKLLNNTIFSFKKLYTYCLEYIFFNKSHLLTL